MAAVEFSTALVTTTYLDARLADTKSDIPKATMGMLFGATAINAAVVLGGIIGLAKLLGP